MDEPGTESLAILACVALGAAVASLQSALHALGEVRLRAMRDAGGPGAKTAARAIEGFSVLQARLLTLRVLALTTAASLAAHLGLRFDGVGAAVAGGAVVAFLYAMIAQVTSTLAERRASRWALVMLRAIRPLELLVTPIAAPMAWAGSVLDRLIPAPPDEGEDRERLASLAVEHMIDEGEEQGAITGMHAELLRSVLEFQDTVAREVMVPRTHTIGLEIETPIADVLTTITEVGHSRYPVYRERIDQVEGVLYAKDVFRLVRERSPDDDAPALTLADVIRRPVFFAAEKQKIGSLLQEMQRRRVHLAVVVDEFGGTSGIVTLEDILEEIVGEIQDEHDVDEEPVVERLPDGRYLADATASVYDVQDTTGLPLIDDDDDHGSIGGLVVELAGRVPSVGESVFVGLVELVVRAADERHVSKVEIVPHEGGQEEEPGSSPQAAAQ
ncbi:MAG TPA: hemolysin family protein [Polyangiaceae bacterium LLY-WYZ-14_1]|nr:hemolysin family protein [Polyangiaceae bacterium LLY-WYZ-14_1]